MRAHLVTTHPTGPNPETGTGLRAMAEGLHSRPVPFSHCVNDPDEVITGIVNRMAATEASDRALVEKWGPDIPGIVPSTYLMQMWKAKTHPESPLSREAAETMTSEWVADHNRELLVELGVGEADPAWDLRVREVADALNDDPLLADLADRYGPVILTTGESRSSRFATWAGGYTPYGVMVILDDSVAAGSPMPDFTDVLTPGAQNAVDESLRGVLVHEYGHHVHPRVTPSEIREFNDAWGEHLIARDDWAEYRNLTGGDGPTKDLEQRWMYPSLSPLATRTVTEGFAEGVAAVTHPVYYRNQFHPNTHRMLSVIEGLLD